MAQFAFKNCFRFSGLTGIASSGVRFGIKPTTRHFLRAPIRTFSQNVSKAVAETTPLIEQKKKIVGSWFFASAGLVYGIVVLGGLTRLTESGLSIVEWKPIKGSFPPMNKAEWDEEFDKYKKSPEFKLNNPTMNLDEFKKIFWMEWAHRQMGRFIGLSFVVPGAFFIAKKWVTKTTALRIVGISGLIGVQGLLGWIMVKSGLSDKIIEENRAARVDHLRLVAHFGTALTIYCAMLWSGLDILQPGNKYDRSPQTVNALRKVRLGSKITFGLVSLTALYGAMVAGLDGGLVYNEYPLMGGRFIPSDWLAMSPTVQNFFNNPVTTQFIHRNLAATTIIATTSLFLYARKLPLTRVSKLAAHSLAGMAVIQVTLGITTLLYFVPLPLASAHQGGSVALLSFALWFIHSLKAVPK